MMGERPHVIPVLNKDRPAGRPAGGGAEELARLVGCEPEDCLKVSGKTGVGWSRLLDEIVRRFPSPVGDADAPSRAVIFDSVYDTYRGVVTYVRVIDGNLNPRERSSPMSTKALRAAQINHLPEPVPGKDLGSGRVLPMQLSGRPVRAVGDTVTNASSRPPTAPGWLP